jgi:hypothetical protein
MNRLQYQIQTGEHIACKSTSSNASTDWTDLNSSDFIDSTSGAALSADLAFVDIAVYNPGSSTAYLKLRARDGAGDSTTNEIFVLAGGAIDLQCAGLKSGAIVNIAYKKGASGDNLSFICAFDRKTV